MNSKIAYTSNYWEGCNYQLTKNLSTKEIAKLIRERLKEEFPKCKFSIVTKVFTGGSEITVSLMEAPFEVFENPENIDLNKYVISEREREIIIERQKDTIKNGYAQLNQYQFSDNYNKGLSNGIVLTEKAWELLKKVVDIVFSFNYDDSDSMIDYFNTRFYFFLHIGKWNKPFKVKGV